MATDPRQVFESLVIKGEWRIVQYVLEKEQDSIDVDQDINVKDGVVFPLLLACRSGNDDMAKRFISLGAKINKKDSTGTTALMAASQGGHKDVVRVLLECAADINIENEAGQTALMFACSHGHVEIVELFLNPPTNKDDDVQEVVVDKANKSGMTALMLAVCKGHAEVVRMLRQKFGALVKLDCQLVLGVNAADVANAKGHQNVLAELSCPLDESPCKRTCRLQPEELARILDIIIRDTDRNSKYSLGGGRYHQELSPSHLSTEGSDSLPSDLISDVTSALRDALMITFPLAAKWTNLGVFLGIDMGLLKAIKQNEHCECDNCLRETLHEWLKRGNATWTDLYKAVYPLDSRISERIRQKYNISVPED